MLVTKILASALRDIQKGSDIGACFTYLTMEPRYGAQHVALRLVLSLAQ